MTSIATEIIDTLNSRGGFDHWWDEVDSDIQQEIKAEIQAIVIPPKPYIKLPRSAVLAMTPLAEYEEPHEVIANVVRVHQIFQIQDLVYSFAFIRYYYQEGDTGWFNVTVDQDLCTLWLTEAKQ